MVHEYWWVQDSFGHVTYMNRWKHYKYGTITMANAPPTRQEIA